MTRTLSIEQLGDLGPELGRGGQARVIKLGGAYATQVAKLYHGELRPPAEALAEVIDWRDTLSAQQQALIDARTSWPTALLADEKGHNVGVILPAIPAEYFASVQAGRHAKIRPRELGYLLNPRKSSDLGIPPPGLSGRMRVCRAWLSVFEVLDSHGIVFGDISMRNLLWCPHEDGGDGYLIDCDTAQTDPPSSPSPWTQDWDDPYLVAGAASQPSDLASDRYKLTLAIYRTMVGHPSARPASTTSAIRAAIPEAVPDAIVGLLLAGSGPDREGRPSPADWLQVLDSWIPPAPVVPRQPDRRASMPEAILTTSARDRRWVPVDSVDGGGRGAGVEESGRTGRPTSPELPEAPKGGASTADRPRSYRKVGETAGSAGPVLDRAAPSANRHGRPTAPANTPPDGLPGWVKSLLWVLLVLAILVVFF